MEQISMQVMELIRLLLSCVCGFLIGYERQNHIRLQHRKSAGMRTHMLVCVASAAMMLISKYGFMDVLVYGDNVRVDVSRVAAAIVSGVGFLGAGIIYVRRESIKGLTTAAGLWATSAVGMAIGCGMYVVGIALAVIVVVVQEMSRISLYRDAEHSATVMVELENQPNAVDRIIDWIKAQGIEISSLSSVKLEGNDIRLTLYVYVHEGTDKKTLLKLQDEPIPIKKMEV